MVSHSVSVGVPAAGVQAKLSRKTVAEYIREHRPHFNLHLHFSRPRFGARRAERVAAAESIARVAEAHARSATRCYGSIVAEQVAAGVRRRQRQLAVQRRLGSLVALHAALVAAQQATCAPYHDLAQELPFYVPPEKRNLVSLPLYIMNDCITLWLWLFVNLDTRKWHVQLTRPARTRRAPAWPSLALSRSKN
ncbi:MAG: hypothetical protein MHM6MM_003213 [Cercozoa sp. M6MM]